MFVTVLLYGSLFGLGYFFKRYFPEATWKLKLLYYLFAPLLAMALVISFFWLMIDILGMNFGIGLLSFEVFIKVISLSWTLWIIVYFTIRESKKDSEQHQPDPKKYDDFFRVFKTKKRVMSRY